MTAVVDHEKIPNNVNLSDDKRLKRALERWHPQFIEWWKSTGPQVFKENEIYLRTAISAETDGWAHFDFVRMPDYRWGIFLAEKDNDRVIPGGDDAGNPVWQEVPGEHRHALRRLIVVQADTEPASVEQQRFLAQTAPSLYDCRNLFQVNVEEARHLWAMVYLLHGYFGKDGRDEADELLVRRSGDEDSPRLLDAFNQPCEDWLSFFAFTCFTDRDGKYQLGALAESAFDPLSRTCRFMLTEEAHHLFVGETGVSRIARRAVQLMKQDPNEDVRDQGGVDLATIQRFINYWYSYSVDLFGAEVSSNASDYFAAGLKGRWREAAAYTEHSALHENKTLPQVENGQLIDKQFTLRSAINETLREDYVEDCEKVIERINRAVEQEGSDFRFTLPHSRFHRRQGLYADHHFDLSGNLISQDAWKEKSKEWLPSNSDNEYLKSLMSDAVLEPGKMANWIAPPKRGIKGTETDFQYVRTDG
jgi:benzoyl-CoA 2,3-epoxidase subunit B